MVATQVLATEAANPVCPKLVAEVKSVLNMALHHFHARHHSLQVHVHSQHRQPKATQIPDPPDTRICCGVSCSGSSCGGNNCVCCGGSSCCFVCGGSTGGVSCGGNSNCDGNGSCGGSGSGGGTVNLGESEAVVGVCCGSALDAPASNTACSCWANVGIRMSTHSAPLSQSSVPPAQADSPPPPATGSPSSPTADSGVHGVINGLAIACNAGTPPSQASVPPALADSPLPATDSPSSPTADSGHGVTDGRAIACNAGTPPSQASAPRAKASVPLAATVGNWSGSIVSVGDTGASPCGDDVGDAVVPSLVFEGLPNGCGCGSGDSVVLVVVGAPSSCEGVTTPRASMGVWSWSESVLMTFVGDGVCSNGDKPAASRAAVILLESSTQNSVWSAGSSGGGSCCPCCCCCCCTSAWKLLLLAAVDVGATAVARTGKGCLRTGEGERGPV